MKTVSILVFLSCMMSFNKDYNQPKSVELPEWVRGNFEDDYGIRYSINDSVWTQHPKTKFHIIKWDNESQFLIARNDDKNPSDGGLYTRIDCMTFNNMEPFLWGFCLSVYNAKNDSLAATTYQADRQNPRKGCNGFPFSRMKKIKS